LKEVAIVRPGMIAEKGITARRRKDIYDGNERRKACDKTVYIGR